MRIIASKAVCSSTAAAGIKDQMAGARDGAGAGPSAGPSGPWDPSETVPEEARELWASLPCCERQRSRRRYFHDQGACCPGAVFSSLLSTIDIRVQNIESTSEGYLHATAASIPVPPARSCKKGARKDADLPSSPAPVNIANGTLPGNPPAAEPARTADLPSPTVSDPTAAAAVCALAPSSAPPVPDGGRPRDSTAPPPGLETLSERSSPSSPAHKRALVHPAAAPADPASRFADEPMAEPTVQPTPTTVPPRPKPTARPYTRFFGGDCWWSAPTPVPSGMVTGPSASDPVTQPSTPCINPSLLLTLPDSEAKHRH